MDTQQIIDNYFREKSAMEVCAALVSRPIAAGQRELTPRQIAISAVEIADALIARLQEQRV